MGARAGGEAGGRVRAAAHLEPMRVRVGPVLAVVLRNVVFQGVVLVHTTHVCRLRVRRMRVVRVCVWCACAYMWSGSQVVRVYVWLAGGRGLVGTAGAGALPTSPLYSPQRAEVYSEVAALNAESLSVMSTAPRSCGQDARGRAGAGGRGKGV